MNETTATSRGKLLGVFILLAIGIAVYLIYDWRTRQHASELKQMVELKNTSLAALENADYDRAIEGFQTIAETVPSEPLGLHNLTIAYLLKLKSLDAAREPDRYEELKAKLNESIAELVDADDQDIRKYFLAARVAELDQQPKGSLAAYNSASKIDRNSALAHYQGFLAMQELQDDYLESARKELIEMALSLSPTNLVIYVTYLKFLAENQYPKTLESLEHANEILKPLSSRTTDTIPKLIEKAKSGVKEKDWQTVQTQLGFLGNLLLAEIAYTNDLNLLNPHELEFVKLDFSESFYDKYPFLRETDTKKIRVTFQAFPEADVPVNAATAIAIANFSLENREELIVAAGKNLRVMHVDKDREWKTLLEHELPIAVSGILTADLDRDFQTSSATSSEIGVDTDLDLIVYGDQGVRILRNDADQEGNRSLSDIPQSEEFSKLNGIRTAAVVDFDHDGDLDLILASSSGLSLWSNRGTGEFDDFSAYSNLPDESLNVTQILPLDLDRNVLVDFLLAVPDSSAAQLLMNNLHGRFTAQFSRSTEHALDRSAGIAELDIDRDGKWDLVTAGPLGTRLTYSNPAFGTSMRGEVLSDIETVGVSIWDYDNDGIDDAISWGKSGIEIFRGTSTGQLEKQDAYSVIFPQDVSQVKITDWDRDGDQDLAVLADGKVSLYSNEGGNAHNWIDVVIRAEENAQRPRERANMHGVGSLLELKAGDIYQTRVVRDTKTHFGLGHNKKADVIRVLWTNGVPHNILAPEENGTIFEQQTLKGSCPYLYTWNGDRFVFATDCLWASPIGLQFAQGILAPAREWEYLKIDGDILQPRDGRYELRMTEELWEAAYYDSVKLFAIDHPADVDVFTNEKVGPASIAEHQIHTVKQKRTPVTAVDQAGRELLATIARADRKFTRCWEDSFTQGLTETHWVELDLGDFANDSEVKLFLTGWVFPTDTSLNIAISQHPEKPQPKPPAIQVLDANGNWTEVIPYMGYPGGKTKTIVVDVSGIFPTDDHRVRIVTNMELCWDECFFTLNEQLAEYRSVELPLVEADLHYRGFSKRIKQPHNGPDDYDYSRVTTAPLWPPMGGDFTRFGDVRELIDTADDQLVVLGAGDEMSVSFAVPQTPLPNGWKRDFVLYNIGWDKDADLNTVQGQQVEPLPFRAMSRYPYGPEDEIPNSASHREYLRTYQTRRQEVLPFVNQIRDWKQKDISHAPK